MKAESQKFWDGHSEPDKRRKYELPYTLQRVPHAKNE
jgi:hypothetical protein